MLSRHRGARVLLAEDNATNREVALELLRVVGLTVDTAGDGAQALAMARTGSYDVILMDVQMPGLDGLQATRAIRALPGWEARPILAMTANAFEEDRQACLEAGMNGFVAKPVDPPALYATLLRWLGSGHPAEAPQPTGTPEARVWAWQDIQGLDWRAGLARVAGNSALYRRLLLQLARQSPVTLRDLQSADRLAERRAQAHALKGAAANLGLVRLAELAREVEVSSAPGLQEALSQELAQVSAAIIRVLEESPPAAAGPDQLGADLERLDHHLQQHEPQALECLLDLLPGLCGQVSGQVLERLSEQVEGFDFESARLTLAELREGLPAADIRNPAGSIRMNQS